MQTLKFLIWPITYVNNRINKAFSHPDFRIILKSTLIFLLGSLILMFWEASRTGEVNNLTSAAIAMIYVVFAIIWTGFLIKFAFDQIVKVIKSI